MTTAAPPAHQLSEVAIERAIQAGIARYFADCRARVPAFIDRHFHYPGAIATNRMALGWDMLRAPINLLWAPRLCAGLPGENPHPETPGPAVAAQTR